jgi:hypothetical protein
VRPSALRRLSGPNWETQVTAPGPTAVLSNASRVFELNICNREVNRTLPADFGHTKHRNAFRNTDIRRTNALKLGWLVVKGPPVIAALADLQMSVTILEGVAAERDRGDRIFVLVGPPAEELRAP